MVFKPLCATLALLPIFVSAGSAITINFSGLDNPSVDRVNLAPSGYDVDGFTFTGTQTPGVWTTGSTGLPVPGTPDNPVGGAASVSLSTFFAGGIITMTKDDSQTFNISSIDVAQWGAGAAGSYAGFFKGYDSGHNLIAAQTCAGADVAGQPVLSTCNLSGFSNIFSLEFEEGTYQSGEAAQFTNIVVNENATPEPGTPFLIGSGFLAMMVLIQKRAAIFLH